MSKTPAFRTPIICVGGILAGGVGKTPIVRAIANRFGAPVVMRGYKRDRRQETGDRKACRGVWHTPESIVVGKNDPVESVGDEAKMLASDGLDVYVGNRRRNIEYINSVPESRITNHESRTIGLCPIVLDDGFQNPTIQKDISILVFDEKIGVGNGWCLPAGPLREPLRCGIKRADGVVIIGHKAQGIGHKPESKIESVTRIANRYQKPVFYAKNEVKIPPTQDFVSARNSAANKIYPAPQGGRKIALRLTPHVSRLFAFAGIGYPQKFFDDLRSNGADLVETVAFADHHTYSRAELEKLISRAANAHAELVTTEKDWVKIPVDLQKKIKFIPLETEIEDAFWKWLEQKIKISMETK